jgi:hypothetical protein
MIMTAVLSIGIALWLPGLRSRRVAAQSVGLMGSYGFTATAPYAGVTSNLGAIIGVITFDGAGNLTGSQTLVSPDPSPNATTVQVQAVSFSGTYTVKADGTGTMKVQVGPELTVPISFVITDGGSGAMFVQTGGANVLVTGTARRQ